MVMIRIIIDNLLYMGIAAAVISLLMLIVGTLSLGRFHARWHLAGWMIAMLTLLIPVYALIGIIQPSPAAFIPQAQAEKYYAAYTEFMGRSITDILNPGTDSRPDLEDLSSQMQMDSPFVQAKMAITSSYTRTAAAVNSHMGNPTAKPPFLAAVSPAASLPPVRNVLFAVWFAVAFLIGTLKLFVYFSFKRRILKNSTPGNGRWDSALPVESLLIIPIREAHIPSPVVFGILRPTVVIPADANDISAVRYSLIHEFMHIERKDLLIKTMAEISAVVQWFNPFAWLIQNKVKSFCENACDEAVAERLSEDSRKSYSNAILDFMDYSLAPEPNLPATLMSFSGDAGNVKKRIKRIMKYKKSNIFVRIFSICIIILITAAGTGTASSLSNYGNKMTAATDASSIIAAQQASRYAGEPTPSPAPLPPIHIDLTGDQGSVYGNPLTMEANDEYVMVLGGENSPLRMDGKYPCTYEYYFGYVDFSSMDTQYSMKGTSLAAILDKDSSKTGKLMYCDGKNVLEVAGDVDSFKLSNDGSTIAYLTGAYEHGVGSTLYLFDCITGETRFITAGASRLFTLSPSGDAIAFCTFYEVDNADALQAFFCVNDGEVQDIGKDCYSVALTDDGSTVYYNKKLEDGEEFYAMHNGEERLLAHPYKVDYINPIPFANYCFNNDCSQVVFAYGDAGYFSINGGEPRLVFKGAGTTYSGTYDLWSGSKQGLYRYITDAGHTSASATFPGTNNLCNILFYVATEYGLVDPVFFDESLKEHAINLPDEIWGITISNQSISYKTFDTAFFVEDYLEPGAEPVNTDSFSYLQSADKTAYSLSYSDAVGGNPDIHELNVYQNGGDAVQISDTVLSISLLEKDGPDILYYLAVPPDVDPASPDTAYTDYFPYADLYTLEDVAGAQPALLADNVCRIETGDYGVVYWQFASAADALPQYYWNDNDLVDVYYSRDGVNFTKILQRSFLYSYGG